MTCECANAEKPSPPYSFGMIIPRNPCSLINCHSASGRSFSSWVISQSSHNRHNSSTGPSRNSCSSWFNRGCGVASSFSHAGFPLNSSPSHQTVPASSASCSVCETFGNTRRNQSSNRSEIRLRRNAGMSVITAAPTSAIQARVVTIAPAPDHKSSARTYTPTPASQPKRLILK